MEINNFISQFREALDLETENLTLGTNIQDLEEWDSMAALMLIDFISNEFNIILDADELIELTTVQSLIDLIGTEKFQK